MCSRSRGALCAVLIAMAALSCKREERRFREVPPTATAEGAVTLTPLHAGPTKARATVQSPYDGNAYAISEGQRLFSWYNCVGCHSHGGGGMGPPLMDNQWIYGGAPQNIFQTIVEGRPNGMPSFRGRIPDYQVWQLVAYVRSLSGLVPVTVQSARSDNMQVSTPPTLTEAKKPRSSSLPPGAIQP